ncbi:hypothetical protein PLICRDRAFT_92058 [Plicaturopsis crispa FD-325 SS-3]|nr:hypothetical protein PLICRDRAFT_92058 [Plicaturopsis crispa FD-325 SS-3]
MCGIACLGACGIQRLRSPCRPLSSRVVHITSVQTITVPSVHIGRFARPLEGADGRKPDTPNGIKNLGNPSYAALTRQIPVAVATEILWHSMSKDVLDKCYNIWRMRLVARRTWEIKDVEMKCQMDGASFIQSQHGFAFCSENGVQPENTTGLSSQQKIQSVPIGGELVKRSLAGAGGSRNSAPVSYVRKGSDRLRLHGLNDSLGKGAR